MPGIEQTTDVLRAVGAVAVFFRAAAADGWDLSDITTAVSDEALRGTVVDAVTGAEQIPGEITDLDLREIMQLAAGAINEFERAA